VSRAAIPTIGRSRAGRQRPSAAALHRSAGDVAAAMGEHSRQRRRTGFWARHGKVAGLAGDQGPAETLWNAASKARRNSSGGRAEQGDSAASGSGVRNKTGITGNQPGIRATAHRLGHAALPERCPGP